MQYPRSIQNLINFFAKFPSVGPKTAERYVFFLLKQDSEKLQSFAQAIAELKEKTTECEQCFSIAETSPCLICANTKRDKTKLCIISNTREMISIESSREYNGLYHVLGGLIDTIDGIKPENIKIKELLLRIKNNQIKEIILALNPTIEGETTSLYIKKILSPYEIQITRIARGLPAGAELEYADEITLANALKFRNKI